MSDRKNYVATMSAGQSGVPSSETLAARYMVGVGLTQEKADAIALLLSRTIGFVSNAPVTSGPTVSPQPVTPAAGNVAVGKVVAADELGLRHVLSNLVVACDGEIEEVFGGELLGVLSDARNALSRLPMDTDTAWEALVREIDRLDADFPNFPEWPVDLPAGFWRDIRLAVTEKAKKRIDASDIGRALKGFIDKNPARYRAAIAEPHLQKWFVTEIVEKFDGQLSEGYVNDLVQTVFDLVPIMPKPGD
jgi:hypothetical protein